MGQQAESCCRHVPACHVFPVVLKTHMDVHFHRDHQRTEADNDDNQAYRLPPTVHSIKTCVIIAIDCIVLGAAVKLMH